MTTENLHRLEKDRASADRLVEAASTLRSALKFADHYSRLDIRNLDVIAIVGAAVEGARLAALCRSQGIQVSALADDNSAKGGNRVPGHIVEPLAGSRTA